jgi:hypothetical protein
MESSHKVKIELAIITSSDDYDAPFMILLDENGNMPSFYISDKKSFDIQVFDFISEFFYEKDTYITNSTKNISTVVFEEDCLKIIVNLIAPSEELKKGDFVSYHKNSMQLHRLTKDISHEQ